MSLVDRSRGFAPHDTTVVWCGRSSILPIAFRFPLPCGRLLRSELPPDRHWKEPLRSAAGTEEAEIVGRDQQPGLRASISDTDTRTQPRGQSIGSRFPIREPAHAWTKAEEPRCNRYALRRLDRRGQRESGRRPDEGGGTRSRCRRTWSK